MAELRRTIPEIMGSLLGALRAGHIPVTGSEVMREIERMARGDMPNQPDHGDDCASLVNICRECDTYCDPRPCDCGME